ncbi:hypothetical protein [Cardinium endosymbiont of Philonthus spinipes]|uniref:hypothetical protein n=1 Tax=Cardinium endosymbiont of Philonthus spinipes TaxID=3077941 RepID=UPI00313E9FBF
MDSLSSIVISLQSEISLLKSSISVLEADNAALRGEIAVLTANNSSLKEVITSLSAATNGLGMMAAHYLLPQSPGMGWIGLNPQQKRLKQLVGLFKRFNKRTDLE